MGDHEIRGHYLFFGGLATGGVGAGLYAWYLNMKAPPEWLLFLSGAFAAVGIIAVALGISSYVTAILGWVRDLKSSSKPSPYQRAERRWESWRLHRALTDVDWLIAESICDGRGGGTSVTTLAALARAFAPVMTLGTLVAAVTRLAALEVFTVNCAKVPDPRATIHPGVKYGRLFICRLGESPKKAEQRIHAAHVKRKNGLPKLPMHPQSEDVTALFGLWRDGWAIEDELNARGGSTAGTTACPESKPMHW